MQAFSSSINHDVSELSSCRGSRTTNDVGSGVCVCVCECFFFWDECVFVFVFVCKDLGSDVKT